jgi:4-diphosphocytidyl-2-C-methyl-D-erythritol kinase
VGLFVSPRREDGYHDIRSLFLPVTIFDTIEFTESDRPSLQCTNRQNGNILIPEDDSNLIIKAHSALSELHPELPGYRIILHKEIPVQAGLGGGSSDCAKALLFFNSQLTDPLPPHELQNIAGKLGSDVPFFLNAHPAYAEGRGEKLSPIADLPALPLLIYKPDCSICTAAAYRQLDQRTNIPWSEFPLKEVMQNLRNCGGRNLSELVFNDFFPVAAKEHPLLNEMKNLMCQNGALYADLSGSGSAMFGVYPDRKTRDSAALKLCQLPGKIICAETIS